MVCKKKYIIDLTNLFPIRILYYFTLPTHRLMSLKRKNNLWKHCPFIFSKVAIFLNCIIVTNET